LVAFFRGGASGILYEKMTYFGRELKLLSEGGYIYDDTLKKFLK
jgi:hypothetical protein